jgi:hypothetical protein
VEISSLQAAFDFTNILSVPPLLAECRTAQLASGSTVMGIQDGYVCFKSNQGHYGWLRIEDTSKTGLVFDWKTFQ